MIAWVLDHLWQSTLFAAGAGLLTLTLRRNGAHLRYWLWFAASVKFLVPFSLLAILGNHMVRRTLGVAVFTPTISYATQRLIAPFSGATPILSAHSAAGLGIAHALLGIWGLGSVALLVYWLARWLRIRAAVRSAIPLPLSAPIPIKCCRSLIEPGLVGIWHPVLLMPEGLPTTLSPDQTRSIVAHELCHLRRRDNLTAAIHMFVQALFWFYPFIWWLGAQLIEERERACDESVISHDSDARTYVESILKVCRFYLQSPLACAAGVSGADFRRRIEAILNNEAALRISFSQELLLAVSAVVACALPVFFGVLSSSCR